MSDSKTVTVSILDKDYQVSCQAKEVPALQRSAEYLDKKMREMRENSNVFGLDRVAVMAALNLTNELLAESEKADALGSQHDMMTNKIADQNAEIANLANKVDSVLVRLKRNHT
ncbi:MAG TPA: cell division protein ZapA [Gammaproteobacteria bacterium]|nr:cell division protein ZapA [Gammaproteobacteria bacterium]|tara:strand:+ start:1528 stop:1869 length:342 start_codon:yes stop_codon:yes gene_type:complete